MRKEVSHKSKRTVNKTSGYLSACAHFCRVRLHSTAMVAVWTQRLPRNPTTSYYVCFCMDLIERPRAAEMTHCAFLVRKCLVFKSFRELHISETFILHLTFGCSKVLIIKRASTYILTAIFFVFLYSFKCFNWNSCYFFLVTKVAFDVWHAL